MWQQITKVAPGACKTSDNKIRFIQPVRWKLKKHDHDYFHDDMINIDFNTNKNKRNKEIMKHIAHIGEDI